jgi:hypothetical protein
MDFECCVADSKYLYVSWTANEDSVVDWPKGGAQLFTGKLFVARKALK